MISGLWHWPSRLLLSDMLKSTDSRKKVGDIDMTASDNAQCASSRQMKNNNNVPVAVYALPTYGLCKELVILLPIGISCEMQEE